MSCNYYVHNDPFGGSKYISGTTCSGVEAYYYLNNGDSVCMNNDLPLINLNNLTISGSCLSITPTPSTTPYEYCFVSGLTYTTTPYQCPNNGLYYDDVYGVLRLTSTIFGAINNNQPDIPVVISNGTDTETVVIRNGETFVDFIYPKVNFRYTDTGCVSTVYIDWYVIGSPTNTQCLFYTPTPTTTPSHTPSQTPTNTTTPTNTQTPTNTSSQTQTNTSTPTTTPTPSITPNPVCPEQLVVSNSNTNILILTNGTYDRVYAVSGSSIQYGYFIIFGITGYVVTGTAPDGNNYPLFQNIGGGYSPTYSYVIARAFSLSNNDLGWFTHGSSTNILNSGNVWGSNQTDYLTSNYVTISSVRFIQSGQNNLSYITYPLVCPTPTPTINTTATPTPSNTSTPTTTPTNTPTYTKTPTPSVTIGITQTPTPSITATQTQTGTPTQTPTNTITQTPSGTPTQTSTPTNTITQTPSGTPAPSCTCWFTFNSGATTGSYSYIQCSNGATITVSIPTLEIEYYCVRDGYTPTILTGNMTIDLCGNPCVDNTSCLSCL